MFVENKVVFKIQGVVQIHLRHKKGIRPTREIGVIPPTRIRGVKEWVIGRSRIKIAEKVTGSLTS